MNQMARWRGRVAVVTGASSGIGRATSRRLVEAGMKVAAAARRVDRLESLAAELAGAPGQLLPLPTDLRQVDAIGALFGSVREAWGGTDVLVNNAGLGRQAPLLSGSAEDWREMLEVNVLALCVATREAVADMRRRGDDGHVIHVSSMAGHRVPGGSGVYSATKYAVRSLTEGLRQELRAAGSGVRVSAISPGFVETGFHAVYHGDERKARETYSRFKVLESEDVAETILHVLSRPPHVQIHDILMRPTEQPT